MDPSRVLVAPHYPGERAIIRDLPSDTCGLGYRRSRFRAEREPGWRRLEDLLALTERRGAAALSYEQALDLASLYRQAMNSLSVARAISMDKALLAYLEALCARAAKSGVASW